MTFRKRRILAALLALALCLSLLPMSALAAETTATTEGGLTVSGGEAGTDYTEYSGRFYTPIPEIGNHRSDMKETAIPF